MHTDKRGFHIKAIEMLKLVQYTLKLCTYFSV